MPKRDYAARAKTAKSGNKLLILIIIILLLLLSGLGLWVLQDKMAPQPAPVKATTPTSQKNELPSKPEEIYSYIRDLETREVPIDTNSKLARLTKEQEQQILKKQEMEKQQLAQQTVQTPTTENQTTPADTAAQPPLTEEQLAAQKAEELKKQQELAKKAEQERKAKEAAKNQPPKIVATAKPASEAPKSVGKYGLQCGAFKSKAQAENMQARLAMAGYNAKVVSSAEWNRVFVGPVGDRAAASAAQSNARSVAECLIVGM
ncbi:cell division protein FtsN [Pasteurellaceae bacterium Orientalotternb1]|nr:cell division protein FtsN [Pasteurellaceae bacterium Orientalotternb1]